MSRSNPALHVLGTAGHAQTWFAAGRDWGTPEALRLLLEVFGALSKKRIYLSHSG